MRRGMGLGLGGLKGECCEVDDSEGDGSLRVGFDRLGRKDRCIITLRFKVLVYISQCTNSDGTFHWNRTIHQTVIFYLCTNPDESIHKDDQKETTTLMYKSGVLRYVTKIKEN